MLFYLKMTTYYSRIWYVLIGFYHVICAFSHLFICLSSISM